MIRVSVDFQGRKAFDNLMRYIENLPFVKAEGEVANLADKTIETMQNKINSSRKRPDKGTHALENSIDWTELINDPGRELVIGIGNIAKMKAEAPYFEVLNDGGYVPPANLGYFGEGESPVKGGSGQNWTHTGNSKDFFMKPKKAIEGIGYVDDGLRFLSKEMDKLLKELGAKFIADMGRESK